MTKKEAALIFGKLSVFWNTEFNDDRKKNMWYEALSDLDFNSASLAVDALAVTEKFPPTIAHIREKCLEAVTPQVNTLDAFSLIIDAISSYGMYKAVEAMEYIKNQDMAVYEIVKSIGFATICKSNINSFRTEFEWLYREVAKEKKEFAMLPDKLKKDIAKLKDSVYRQSLSLLEGD